MRHGSDRREHGGTAPVSGPSGQPVVFGLLWPIKASRLRYVRRLPDGEISIDDQVGLIPDGAFHFHTEADGGFDVVVLRGTARFRGVVHLSGHGGALGITIANPWLHVTSAAVRLSIEATFAPVPGRIEVVESTRPRWSAGDGVVALSVGAPTLTGPGAALMGGFYGAGTVVGPLQARVRA